MTGNQSKPWHPDRKHYRCSRRENLTLLLLFSMGVGMTICLREKAIFGPAQKCPYHVTFDLDLDLEHILDAC